jgi:ABC-2 type transport system permease protein
MQNLLAFEWIKFHTVRATLWTLVACAAAIPIGAVFVAATGSLQPDDTILGGSLTTATLSQMIAAALGALVVTTEYRSGTIRSTFAAVPTRWRVLVAKAALVAVALFAVSLGCSAAGFAIGRVMLSPDEYRTGSPMPALLGVAVTFAVTGVLGVAIGAIVRQSAGAITAVVGVMLLPALLGPLFGDWQRWVGGATPTATLEKLTQTSDASSETVGSLGGWASLVVLTAATLVVLAGAAWVLERRDA